MTCQSSVNIFKGPPLKLLAQFDFNFICCLQAKRERKFIYFDLGDMIKVAVMPIYGKILKKFSSLELLNRLPLNLVCRIWGVISLKFI